MARAHTAGVMRPEVPDGAILVLTEVMSSSVSLYFSFLPREAQRRVVVRDIASGITPGMVARASAIVWIRHVFGAIEPYVAMARAMGIPQYLFVDDNFRVMVAEYDEGRLLREALTSLDADALTPFDGVLVSSRTLESYFAKHDLHRNVLYFPPCIAPDAPIRDLAVSRSKPHDLVVGFAGGSHRWASLRDYILPALRAVAEEHGRHIRLVVSTADTSILEGVDTGPHLTVSIIPFDFDVTAMLERFATEAPDVMVHATAVHSANLPYKTVHPLLVSDLLGCAHVFPAEPPYIEADLDEAAFIVSRPTDSSSWIETLNRALFDDKARTKVAAGNRRFTRKNFSGRTNAKVISAILKRSGAPSATPGTVEGRLEAYARYLQGLVADQSRELGRLGAALGNAQLRIQNLERGPLGIFAAARRLKHLFRSR